MGISLFILAGLHILSLGILLEKHGKPKTGNYNVWIQLIGVLIEWILIYFSLI